MTSASIITDFEKVCEFNKCFDFPTHDDMSDQKCLKLRHDLIKEEIDELKEAISNNDIIEEQDACSDILYVAYGMAYTYKWNSDQLMEKYFIKSTLSNSSNEKNLENTLYKRLNFVKYTRGYIIESLEETFDKLVYFSKENNIENTKLHLHELIYLVYNFEYVNNYDSDRNFAIVHNSNMSKLCKTEEEARKTVEKYENEYKNGTSPYDTPYYYKLDNDMYIVKNRSTGKALKSINYTKVNFI